MQDPSFKDFVLDQLRGMGEIHCRKMFGGYGLYRNGSFFGIIYDTRLYLKTDAHTRDRYLKFGMQPFQPSPRQRLKRYYEVPADILEDPSQIEEWARQAAGSSEDLK